jgi:hypothetical protein
LNHRYGKGRLAHRVVNQEQGRLKPDRYTEINKGAEEGEFPLPFSVSPNLKKRYPQFAHI